MSTCERCGTSVPSYDMVHYGDVSKSETLCTVCFNAVAADQIGIEIESANFQPVTLKDNGGRSHVFHLRRRLYPIDQVLEAFEVRRGAPTGYQFGILGDFTEDPMELLGRLYERMRKGLAHASGAERGRRAFDVYRPNPWPDIE